MRIDAADAGFAVAVVAVGGSAGVGSAGVGSAAAAAAAAAGHVAGLAEQTAVRVGLAAGPVALLRDVLVPLPAAALRTAVRLVVARKHWVVVSKGR